MFCFQQVMNIWTITFWIFCTKFVYKLFWGNANVKTDKEYSLQILMVLETWTGVSSLSWMSEKQQAIRKEVLLMEPKVPASNSEPFESSPTVCVVRPYIFFCSWYPGILLGTFFFSYLIQIVYSYDVPHVDSPCLDVNSTEPHHCLPFMDDVATFMLYCPRQLWTIMVI